MPSRVHILEPSMRPVFAAAGFRHYSDFVDTDQGQIVSESGTTLTRRIELPAGAGGETVYLKRYRYEGDRWRHRFRRHKGAVEARNYRYLRARCGIHVPDVVALGVRRRGLRLVDAFLVTRAVDASPLEAAWRDAADMRRTLVEAVADVVARMHAAHFYHCDLQWRNILVRLEGGAVEVHLIDSSRGGPRRTWMGRAHGCVRDLASLDKLARRRLTRTQRLRWLRRYLARRGSACAARSLIRRVMAYASSKENG